MIYITGDTHGDTTRFRDFDLKLKKGDYIIICGDFGYIFYPPGSERAILQKIALDELSKRPYTILFVDGNHENFDELYRYPEENWNGGKIHRIRPNIIHLCRGQVFDIEGKKFFTMGGGYSIDKAYRTEGISWWPQEMPADAEFAEANTNLDRCGRKVDYIITHTAPLSTLELQGVHKLPLKDVGNAEKPLNNFLQYIDESVKYKHWYIGHFHRDMELLGNKTMLWFDIKAIE